LEECCLDSAPGRLIVSIRAAAAALIAAPLALCLIAAVVRISMMDLLDDLRR
jgi:hypothetical protein